MEREFIVFKIADDPQEYKLCYDFNQLVDAEELTGCNLLAAFMGGGLNAKAFRALLYACLKTAHPHVLLSEAGDLMSKDRATVMAAVGKVLGGEISEPEQPENDG